MESVAASSRPPGAGPARRMRSRSAAWLLGGTLLLAASASCNYTSRGEKPGGGGLAPPGSRVRADGASGAGARRLFCCLRPPPLHLETPLGRFAGESQRPGRLEWAGEQGGNPEGSASLPTGWLLCKHQVAKSFPHTLATSSGRSQGTPGGGKLVARGGVECVGARGLGPSTCLVLQPLQPLERPLWDRPVAFRPSGARSCPGPTAGPDMPDSAGFPG